MDNIHFLVLWLGTKCNLRCKNCANLVPYLEDTEYDVQKIIANMHYLTKDVFVQNIQIQGGEPFLYKELGHITEICAKNEHIGHITIASNATIRPSEEIIDILSKYNEKIDVRYSAFECVDKVWRQQLIEDLSRRGVNAGTYHFIFGNGKWYDSGDYAEFNEDTDEVYRMYKRCASRHCWTYLDDYLVNCSKIYSLMLIRNNIDVENNNMLNITEARLNKKEIKVLLDDFDYRYIHEAPYMCGYCKGTDNYIAPGIQLTGVELEKYRNYIRERQADGL